MGKANKFIVIALSAILLLVGSYAAGRLPYQADAPGKHDILYDPQTEAAYDLCDAARDMIGESVVLYTGSPAALVNGLPCMISSNNPEAVPIIENNEIYVPAAFIAYALGARSHWYADASVMAINSGYKSISFITGQNKMSVNGTQVFLPYPTYNKYGEAYIHLPSICEVLGRNVSYHGNIIMIDPIGRSADFKEDEHIVNDLLYYFNGGRIPPSNDSHEKAAIPYNAGQSVKGGNVRLYLNQDELNLYAFPITEIDPDASVHDHRSIIEDSAVMAPVVLMRLLEVDVFEVIKPNSISLLEASPFGNYTSITLKPGTDHAYLNIPGEDPYKDEDAFKDRLVVLSAAPKLMNNHLYIPIADISRLLGIKADWDQKSSTLRLSSMGFPRFPNLRWAPQIIQNMRSSYELTMAISLKGSDGKDIHRLNCMTSGIFDSGEYTGRAAVGISSETSGLMDSDALYEVKRFLNEDYEYEYSVRDLKSRTHKAGPLAAISYDEILMTDIEYLRRKVEVMTCHFYASDLLRKQPDVLMRGKPVDRYSMELNDMPSIVELFGIRRIPGMDAEKPPHDIENNYIFDSLRMELTIDKNGKVVNCLMNLRGRKKNERQTASLDSEEYKPYISFEVSINADFY